GYGRFQYQIGQTYTMDPDQIEPYVSGFHFCRYAQDVFEHYNQPDSQYAEIRAEGKIVEDYNQLVTNQITILRLLTIDQLIELSKDQIVRSDGTIEYYQ